MSATGAHPATTPQKVTTFLMFEGRAEEAMTFYTSLFDDGRIVSIDRYGPGEQGVEGTVRHAVFALAGQEFMCIDSAVHHEFTFTAATSLYVRCETEEEIDRRYAELIDGGHAFMPLGNYGFSAKFGWVADRFGVSWQLNLAADEA